MPLFEGKTPAERNKTIIALALGTLALLFLARMFFGSSKPTPTRNANTRGNRTITQTTKGGLADGAPDEQAIGMPQPVPPIINASYDGADGGRNIFAFYEPVKKTIDPATLNTPIPTPEPTPPLVLSGVAPSNIFARTDDFTLTVTGDKFTPQARIYFDSQELPTNFASAQQLTATVPGALISAPGTRQIVVRTPDGQLYSNGAALSVADPPKPQFTYIGLLGGARYNDKAMLKSPSNGGMINIQRGDQTIQAKDVATVQRGDVVDGRFRVTSISERSVDFVDTQLKVKHTLPYVEARNATGPRPYAPPPPSTDDDDEPEP
jgi:hypothetical protein